MDIDRGYDNRWLDRRGFIRVAGLTGLAICGLGAGGCKTGFSRTAEAGIRVPRENTLNKGVFAAKGGDDPYKLTVAAVAAAGGMSALVSKGDKVVVKPNIAWDRSEEQAANTNPQVVAAVVHMALEAGAAEVRVFDRACNSARKTYSRSGVAAAAEKAGAKVFHADDDRFSDVKIPGAKTLTEWLLIKDVLEADVFINVPILKHHGATQMTAGMKNLMGCAGGNRGAWHVARLEQRIADVQLAVRPDLVIVDAFRMLMDHGPQGGSLEDVKMGRTVAVSTDVVAVDAYAATLMGFQPSDIKYIKIGAEMGLGEMNLNNVSIHEESVA